MGSRACSPSASPLQLYTKQYMYDCFSHNALKWLLISNGNHYVQTMWCLSQRMHAQGPHPHDHAGHIPSMPHRSPEPPNQGTLLAVAKTWNLEGKA